MTIGNLEALFLLTNNMARCGVNNVLWWTGDIISRVEKLECAWKNEWDSGKAFFWTSALPFTSHLCITDSSFNLSVPCFSRWNGVQWALSPRTELVWGSYEMLFVQYLINCKAPYKCELSCMSVEMGKCSKCREELIWGGIEAAQRAFFLPESLEPMAYTVQCPSSLALFRSLTYSLPTHPPINPVDCKVFEYSDYLILWNNIFS